MQPTAQSIYQEVVRPLRYEERLRLAAIILHDLSEATNAPPAVETSFHVVQTNDDRLRQLFPVGQTVPMRLPDNSYEAAATLQAFLESETGKD